MQLYCIRSDGSLLLYQIHGSRSQTKFNVKLAYFLCHFDLKRRNLDNFNLKSRNLDISEKHKFILFFYEQ